MTATTCSPGASSDEIGRAGVVEGPGDPAGAEAEARRLEDEALAEVARGGLHVVGDVVAGRRAPDEGGRQRRAGDLAVAADEAGEELLRGVVDEAHASRRRHGARLHGSRVGRPGRRAGAVAEHLELLAEVGRHRAAVEARREMRVASTSYHWALTSIAGMIGGGGGRSRAGAAAGRSSSRGASPALPRRLPGSCRLVS